MQMFLHLHLEHEVSLFTIKNFPYKGIACFRDLFKKKNALFRNCMKNDNSLSPFSYLLVRDILLVLVPILTALNMVVPNLQ